MARKKQTIYTKRLLQDKTRGELPPDADLEWFLRSSDAALGERSSMGALTAMIEFGIPTGTNEPDARITDHLLGMGQTIVGDVERERRCAAAWAKVGHVHRQVLLARYCLIVGKLPPGLHGGLGDLAGVGLLCAHRRDETAKLLQTVQRALQTKGANEKAAVFRPWASRAQKANVEAHAVWVLARAEAEQVA